MVINLENCQDKIEISQDFIDFIKNIAKYVLEFEEVNFESEVNILFVDNDEIKKVNFEHRGINKETDCLSFPMLSYDKGKVFKNQYKNYKFKDYDLEDGRLILGDILLSLEKAKEQSVEFKHNFEREVGYLTIHSLLHLLGYDHMEEDEKVIMTGREKEIVRELKIFK